MSISLLHTGNEESCFVSPIKKVSTGDVVETVTVVSFDFF